MELGDPGQLGENAAGPVEEECQHLSGIVTVQGQLLEENIALGKGRDIDLAILTSAHLGHRTSGKCSAQNLTMWHFEANTIHGKATKEVG